MSRTCICEFQGGANNNPANLQAFHNDVNQLLRNIDAPIKDEDLSDIDENDLMVNILSSRYIHIRLY